MKRTTLKYKVLLVIFGVFISLFVLEISFRISGFIYLSLQEIKNSHSVRQSKSYKILCVGDSMTALGGDHSYPRQMERILNKNNSDVKFSVINKGVPGNKSAFIFSEIESQISEYKPDMVIVMMGVNDEWDPVPCEEVAENNLPFFIKSLKICKLSKLIKLHIESFFVEPKSNADKEEKFDYIQAALGRISLGDFKTGSVMFKRLLELNPKNIFFVGHLGYCYRMLGDYEQAEKMFKMALKQDSENSWLYSHLGAILQLQGKFDESENILEKSIKLNPQEKWTYYVLASVYISKGEHQKARDLCDKAVKFLSDKAWFYSFKSTLENNDGNKEISGMLSDQADKIRLKYFNPISKDNFNRVAGIVRKKKLKLICMQYPIRDVEGLKLLISSYEGIVFVSNEDNFKMELKEKGFNSLFTDYFAGDFGHCTSLGNSLIAKNAANAILKILNLN